MVLLMSFIAKGDGKPSTNKWLVRITHNIKTWTAFITVLDILFISFIGQVSKKGLAGTDTNSDKFKKALPLIYNNLNIIGMRSLEDPFKPMSNAKAAHDVMIKFDTYIIYLIASIFLHYTYSKERRMALLESQAIEIDY